MKSEIEKRIVELSNVCGRPDEMAIEYAEKLIGTHFDDIVKRVANIVKFIEDPHEDRYGVVCEWFNNETKKWYASEVADESILYRNIDFNRYSDAEVNVGLYERLGKDCWGDCEGDDWDFRLGVKDVGTAVDEPVYGESTNEPGSWYRLRRVVLGPFSKKAKDWMYANLDAFKPEAMA